VTLAELGSLGELVGAIATVATLAYLAVQIRNSTSAVKAASAQSVHENFATWYRMLATNAEVSAITTKGCRDYSSLSETEKGQFIALSMAMLLCSQDAFLKWREGSLSGELWVGWEFVVQNLILSPGGKELWRERGYMFGSAYREYVEGDLIRRAPHPDAMPLGAFSLSGATASDDVA